MRGLLAAAVAAALAPLVTASQPPRTSRRTPRTSRTSRAGDGAGIGIGGGAGGGQGEPQRFEAGFDEMYRGCRIRGFRDTLCGERPAGPARPAEPARPAGAARATSRTAAGGSWRVTVDDRPLHLMRRADGGYLTMVDHYQSYPTPLAAARAAVDELGGTLRLRATAARSERGEGHGHGVRT